MATNPSPAEGHVRPFADWLREQSGGRTHDDLTEALAEVVTAVGDTGKKGTVTLTITVAPLDKNGGSALTVTDAIKKAVPQHDRRKSIFYGDKAGNLLRDDPRQPTFEGLTEVPQPVTAPIDIHSKEQHA